jgi:hypothetical protein
MLQTIISLEKMKTNILPSRSIAYKKVADEEDGNTNLQQQPSAFRACRIIIVFLLFSLSICAYTHWILTPTSRKHGEPRPCNEVSTRREWRTLTMRQKHEYVSAVQCLKTQPSKLGLNHTLYDDFPYIHSRVGSYGELETPPIAKKTDLTVQFTMLHPSSHGIGTSSIYTRRL